MGGSSSKATTNVKTRSVVDAVARNIMDCRSNTTVKQSFIVSGNYNIVKNSKQVQHTKLSSSCAQDTKNITNLQRAVANAVKQSASSQSVSLIGVLGKSESEVISNIEDEVIQNITQENIQRIINESNATQEIVISGNNNIIDNFNQTQTFEIVFKNAQKVVNELKSVQAIENATNQSSVSTQTNPISEIISSIGGIITGTWGIIAIVVVVVIITVAYFLTVVVGVGDGVGDISAEMDAYKAANESGGI